MTVAELIAKLQTMDQNLPVWLGSNPCCYGPCAVEENQLHEEVVDGKYLIDKEEYEKLNVAMIDL